MNFVMLVWIRFLFASHLLFGPHCFLLISCFSAEASFGDCLFALSAIASLCLFEVISLQKEYFVWEANFKS